VVNAGGQKGAAVLPTMNIPPLGMCGRGGRSRDREDVVEGMGARTGNRLCRRAGSQVLQTPPHRGKGDKAIVIRRMMCE